MVRDKIISLREQNPGYTLQCIGDIVGRTRERVRPVLKEEGLPTVNINFNPNEGACRVCGVYMGYSMVGLGWLCADCRRIRDGMRMKEYYRRNPERFKGYVRKYAMLNRKATNAMSLAKNYHPVRGICVASDCQRLGVRHHLDYSKPKEIVWLCPLHHKQVHRGKLNT